MYTIESMHLLTLLINIVNFYTWQLAVIFVYLNMK